MNRIKLTLIFIFLSIILSPLNAAPHNTHSISERVGVANGLSNNGATAMLYDSNGYLWIATYDGLNRYNGYKNKIYKNNSTQKLLPTNRVRALFQDNQDRIWIGTDEGVVVYDYEIDSFISNDDFAKGGIIREIIIIDDLVYCISESLGIFIYDMNLKLVSNEVLDGGGDFSDIALLENRIFITSTVGLIEYNTTHKEFIHHFKNEIVNLRAITILDSQTLLLGNINGLIEIKIEGQQLKRVSHTFKDAKIKTLFIDSEKSLWIGTEFDGVIYVSNFNTPDEKRSYHLPNNRISDFKECTNGDVWISTFDRGVCRFAATEQPFYTPEQIVPLKMPLIWQLDNDRLLIRSRDHIYIYNIATRSYDKCPKGLSHLSDMSNGVYPFIDNNKSFIWWFSNNGCYLYDIKRDLFKKIADPRFEALGKSLPNCVVQDMNDDIWVGYTNKLFRISLRSDGSIRALESIYQNSHFATDPNIGRVRALFSDSENKKMWIGTDSHGLYTIKIDGREDLAQVNVNNYRYNETDSCSLSSNFVSSILRDNNGVMWIGTEQGGLCRVQEQDDELNFVHFGEEDGLSNNVVKALQCDSQGRLWIATNLGLNSFDSATEYFRTYRIADGLPFDEFLYNNEQCYDGTLIFTGATEFCLFDPSKSAKSEGIPDLHFNDLYIYDEIIKPTQKYNNRVILDHRLKSGDSFTLNHDENNLSIGVDVLYDQSASYHHYHYILEPTSKDWTMRNVTNSEITFNALSPGRYTLKVKASNSYGNMSSEEVLYIRIKRPLYGSIGAFIIYGLLALSIIIIVVYIIMRNQALQYNLTLEAQEKEGLKLANLEKQRYFSNISHELKTPLTLISAPLSILTEKFKLDANIRTNLAIMQRQTRKMLQLIDLAHGIQLSDENRLELKPEVFVVRDLLKDIASDFEFLAEFDKKRFSVEYPDSLLKVNADRNMLEKVLNNLLNNAFKYTSTNEEIVVTYKSADDKLSLTVRDNGSGITAEDLPYIFERFYTSKQIETKKVGGTGIGLAFSKYMIELHGGTISVDSEYGKGTKFIVELPIIIEEMEIPETIEFEEPHSEQALINSSSQAIEDNIEVDKSLCEKMVYVVEDNGEMRAFISDIVANYFKVTSFASAKECLAAMESEWPDIIVSDVMMPDMDGDKMCEIIKSDLRTSHIPIILLTARYTVDDKIKGIDLGADSYIGKPFYPRHLITRINSLLRGRQKLYEHFQKGLPLSNATTVSSRDAELLTSIYALFDKNLDDDEVELDSFAEELGINRTLFYSKVKALTNMSPYELLKGYRLQKANELLRSGEYNVNEVCDMTGFKSRTHFSRVFKQQFGVAPSKVEK